MMLVCEQPRTDGVSSAGSAVIASPRSAAAAPAMRASLEALDLASEAETQLTAAEVTLLMRRASCRKADAPSLPSDPETRLALRAAPRPAVAEAWLGCLGAGPALRTEASWEARLMLTLPGGGWTHWLEPLAAPRCHLEALALAVMCFHVGRLGSLLPSRSIGVEWWVQVRDVDESIGVHWDCDEALKDRTGEHVSPYLATVTYLGSAGSPTIVLPVSTDAAGHGVLADTGGSGGGGGGGASCYASFPVAGTHRLQCLTTVAACMHLRLQPAPPTVAAWRTYGCRQAPGVRRSAAARHAGRRRAVERGAAARVCRRCRRTVRIGAAAGERVCRICL